MLLEFLEICFEDIRPAWQKPEKFGPLTAKSSAIIVSMQSKRGTGGAINVGNEDDACMMLDQWTRIL